MAGAAILGCSKDCDESGIVMTGSTAARALPMDSPSEIRTLPEAGFGSDLARGWWDSVREPTP